MQTIKRRTSSSVPFGYKLDPDNKDFLVPVYSELEALEYARNLRPHTSYRTIAEILKARTGRTISHVGVKKALAREY